MICQGRMFGPDQPIAITLLEIPPLEANLHGIMMEIKDCAFPLVHEVKTSIKPDEAFVGC